MTNTTFTPNYGAQVNSAPQPIRPNGLLTYNTLATVKRTKVYHSLQHSVSAGLQPYQPDPAINVGTIAWFDFANQPPLYTGLNLLDNPSSWSDNSQGPPGNTPPANFGYFTTDPSNPHDYKTYQFMSTAAGTPFNWRYTDAVNDGDLLWFNLTNLNPGLMGTHVKVFLNGDNTSTPDVDILFDGVTTYTYRSRTLTDNDTPLIEFIPAMATVNGYTINGTLQANYAPQNICPVTSLWAGPDSVNADVMDGVSYQKTQTDPYTQTQSLGYYFNPNGLGGQQLRLNGLMDTVVGGQLFPNSQGQPVLHDFYIGITIFTNSGGSGYSTLSGQTGSFFHAGASDRNSAAVAKGAALVAFGIEGGNLTAYFTINDVTGFSIQSTTIPGGALTLGLLMLHNRQSGLITARFMVNGQVAGSVTQNVYYDNSPPVYLDRFEGFASLPSYGNDQLEFSALRVYAEDLSVSLNDPMEVAIVDYTLGTALINDFVHSNG
jgi:hypothetical protein